jgi:hypothetical protein
MKLKVNVRKSKLHHYAYSLKHFLMAAELVATKAGNFL